MTWQAGSSDSIQLCDLHELLLGAEAGRRRDGRGGIISAGRQVLGYQRNGGGRGGPVPRRQEVGRSSRKRRRGRCARRRELGGSLLWRRGLNHLTADWHRSVRRFGRQRFVLWRGGNAAEKSVHTAETVSSLKGRRFDRAGVRVGFFRLWLGLGSKGLLVRATRCGN